ncbi:hypothetical protein [Embleya sp. NPDC050493]|uniref:hypothetical protein n=1 Tax=Embleya sp. NPDC050493 TaxID=3363989 RepID=UPI0037A04A36
MDADLRRYDVDDPTDKDHRTLNLAKLMLGGQAGLGNPRAVQFLNHWLENTGTPVEFDPQTMIREVPGLKGAIDRAIAENAGKGRFDSQWKAGAIHEDITALQQQGKSASPELLDWYYALNGYQYRISGDVKEIDGKIVGDIRVDVSKRYDWGNPGGKPRADIDLKFTDVPQEDLARLNATGLAQDYDVRGSTTFWVETPAPAKS